MSEPWPTVLLGDVLRRSENVISLNPQTMYKEVTVRMNGKGVIERRVVQGNEISSDRRFQARSGQFIISRIDARHGASGLIPAELDGAIVTNDFPLFDVVSDRLEPCYLNWLSKTATFVGLCKQASEGTTNRVRLSETRFKALEIPLPPLNEQRRIVRKIEELTTMADEARRLRSLAMQEAGFLLERQLYKTFNHASKEWTVATVATIAQSIDAGWSPRCDNVPATSEEWGVLKTTSVQWCEFRPEENKRLPSASVPRPELGVKQGDVLITRAGPMKRVGVSATARSDYPNLMISDKIIRIRPKPDVIDPRFLEFALTSPLAQEHLVARKTGLADAQVNISQSILLATPVAYPSLPKQRSVVEELDALKSKIDDTIALQSESGAELDAMVPAILDKAFKGEL